MVYYDVPRYGVGHLRWSSGFGEEHVLPRALCCVPPAHLFPHNCDKNRRQEHLLRAALSAGRSVVVGNTNPTPEDRRPLVRLGHEYGAKVLIYFFEVGVRECLRRNEMREGKARVPDVAIYTTAKKLVALRQRRDSTNSSAYG